VAQGYYDTDFERTDFRREPEKYRVGKGEQGVLLVQPYKSELLPHWRFRTPEVAEVSSKKLLEMFYDYLAAGDFVGADMARKFLQMGWTRARRYANHRSGKKYDGPVPDDKKGQSGAHGRRVLPHQGRSRRHLLRALRRGAGEPRVSGTQESPSGTLWVTGAEEARGRGV
jgi:hypothetical protein